MTYFTDFILFSLLKPVPVFSLFYYPVICVFVLLHASSSFPHMKTEGRSDYVDTKQEFCDITTNSLICLFHVACIDDSPSHCIGQTKLNCLSTAPRSPTPPPAQKNRLMCVFSKPSICTNMFLVVSSDLCLVPNFIPSFFLTDIK